MTSDCGVYGLYYGITMHMLLLAMTCMHSQCIKKLGVRIGFEIDNGGRLDRGRLFRGLDGCSSNNYSYYVSEAFLYDDYPRK